MTNQIDVKQLSRLGRAFRLQNLAGPILKKGDTSQTDVYYNVVLKEFAMCENTFRTLMQVKGAENYPALLKEYRRQQLAKHMARLKTQRKKRIK